MSRVSISNPQRNTYHGNDDRYVVVMGPAGVGKSTFIQKATGSEGKIVGHGLRSCTSDIQATRALHPNQSYPFVFVDTPGFDNTNKSDTAILSLIAEWFVKSYNEKAKLAGIIYLHRISDNRMAGSLLKNLELFRSLCGHGAMPKVIIATTMWSDVEEEIGFARERELKEYFWKDMLNDGCKTRRFMDTQESAWNIIDDLTGGERREPVLLSEEIVDKHLRLNKTRVGTTLNNELKRLIKDHKDASRRLQRQAEKQRDGLVAQELVKHKNAIDQKTEQLAAQLSKMESP